MLKIKNWPVTQPACLPPPLGILDICRSNGARWQRKWRHIYIDFRFGFHKSRLALSPPHLAHKLTTLGACASDKLTTVDACASVKVGGEDGGAELCRDERRGERRYQHFTPGTWPRSISRQPIKSQRLDHAWRQHNHTTGSDFTRLGGFFKNGF